ncbi:MAG: DUF3159 domain-containing protein [Beutenbergiaceae bacterium]
MTGDAEPGAANDDVARDRGLKQLAADEFQPLAAIGGWRGLAESVAPGLVFVVSFVALGQVSISVIASVAVAVVATLLRLVQRTPVTQAVGGLLGVAIGAVWAWRSGAAEDFYLWGLLTNAAFAVVIAGSILARWPVVGVIVATLFGHGHRWRSEPVQLRRYTIASALWLAVFVARLAVQLPLYLNTEVAWLGAARLVMGLPLWALVLWLTWILVNPRAVAAAQQDPPPARTRR